MARLLTCGFEAGATAAETSDLGGLEIQGTAFAYSTAQVRSGAKSALVSGGSSGAGSNNIITFDTIPVSSGVTYYSRVAVYATTYATTGDQCVLAFVDTAHADGARLILTSTATEVVDRGSGSVISSGSAVPTGGWHVVEFEFTPYTGAYVVQVDGTEVTSGSATAMTSSTSMYPFFLENPTGTCTLYADDLALNDNTGSDQNSWCGQGQVVLLLPTADSSRTGFKAGDGGATTDLFDAVNNIPPNGKAQASGGAGAQVEDNTSNTTDNYVATLATYTAAGVPSGATIELVEAVACIGNSSATSRQLGLQVTGNPGISEFVGSTSTTTAGSYPTGWTTINTAYSYAPSVTLGTAPTVEIRKATASTNYSMCCFMGLLVEYLPGTGYPWLNCV